MNVSFILAAVIMESAGIREQSFNPDQAYELQKSRLSLKTPNFEPCYSTSLEDACRQACEKHNQPELADLIHSMLSLSWNPSIEWAGTILYERSEQEASKQDSIRRPNLILVDNQ